MTLGAVSESTSIMTTKSKPTQAVNPANVANAIAILSNPAADIKSIGRLHPQEIGHVIGALSLTSHRFVAYCIAEMKGFPTAVKDADEKGIRMGLQMQKCALDTAKGRDFEIVEIGEDRWITRAEWVKGPGSKPDAEPKRTFNVTSAACMAFSPGKLKALKDHKGGLKSFIQPRRNAVKSHVSARYLEFLALAVRHIAESKVQAALEAGKPAPVTQRVLLSMDAKLAKVFFRAAKLAADSDYETVKPDVLTAAVEAFWTTLGRTPPTLDDKGNPV
jgi:hypothetical protein